MDNTTVQEFERYLRRLKGSTSMADAICLSTVQLIGGFGMN